MKINKILDVINIINKFLAKYGFIIFCVIILLLSLRGHLGVLTEKDLNSDYWTKNGPFEVSPERGRFALTFSLLENNSFFYSLPIARFVLPDLGIKNGKYVSLFAPGISFLIMPGYFIGKSLGSSQLGAYAVITLFALFNILLIREISKRLGFSVTASELGSLVFIFATPAFNYGITLYQHHVSTFLILFSVYLLLSFDNWIILSIVWFLFAASIPIDYPNLILMFPLALFALGKIIYLNHKNSILKIKISYLRLLTFIVAVFPLLFFLWFNNQSYNNPLQFSGTVQSVLEIDKDGNPESRVAINAANLEKTYNKEIEQKSVINFFQSRNFINGLYIHLISPDRGIIYYSPVIFISLVGIYLLYKKNRGATQLLLSIMVLNLTLYSLWGDPWGGWAFGSRYLIPLYAIASIFIAAFLDKWGNKTIVLLILTLLMAYSVFVNTSGALTSSANPPQVQVLNLEKISGIQQRYSFDRNIFTLQNGVSKSFMFESIFSKYLTAYQYYILISLLIVFYCEINLLRLRFFEGNNK